MKELFKGVQSCLYEGFMMVHCGSDGNGNEFVVTTNRLHSTDVADLCPEVANPKTCAELIARLLNEYYDQKG